jgi:Cu+-exporting ATPase
VQPENSESNRPPGDRPLVLSIGGLRCNNCAASVEELLRDMRGVIHANVSFAVEEARIDFDPSRTELPEIIEAIRQSGYEARERSRERTSERMAREIEEEQAATSRRRRMLLGLSLSAFIMLLSMGPHWIGLPDFPGRIWMVCAAAAVVQIFVGGEYYAGAWNAARARSTNMDTLVALGSSVAFFIASLYSSSISIDTPFPSISNPQRCSSLSSWSENSSKHELAATRATRSAN